VGAGDGGSGDLGGVAVAQIRSRRQSRNNYPLTLRLTRVVFCAVMALLLSAGLLLAAIAAGLWYSTRKSRKYWKLLARIGAVALAFLSALTFFVLFLFSGALCGRYDFPRVSSADGRLIAQVSEKDCGAVDSFHSSVQLWRDRRGLSARLFGKQENSTIVFTIGHDPRLLALEWKGAKKLLIHYPNDSERLAEFRCQSQWDDVQIECIAYTPDYNKPVAQMPPVKRGFW